MSEDDKLRNLLPSLLSPLNLPNPAIYNPLHAERYSNSGVEARLAKIYILYQSVLLL
jgi:hypothetical protein